MKKKWALVVPAVLALASCDEPDVHILTAQVYDPAAACLGESSGVDVIQGGSTGDNCSPSCLTTNAGDTTSIYVTTMCPPFPDYTVEGMDATTGPSDPCTGAFAAYAAYDGATCPPADDGGEEGGDDGGGMAGDASDAGTTDAGTGD